MEPLPRCPGRLPCVQIRPRKVLSHLQTGHGWDHGKEDVPETDPQARNVRYSNKHILPDVIPVC